MHRNIIPTPQPLRKWQSPEDDAPSARDEAHNFIDSIVRTGNAEWFQSGGRRLAAVWLQEITPEIAQEWIGRVDENHQRGRTESIVKRYCADMRNGAFIPGIPQLIFDRRARLINGQHVLKAFITSEARALIVTVQVNLHERAYQAPDQNKKRSIRDALKWSGVAHPGDVAGVVKVLFQYHKGYYKGKGYLGARSGEKMPTNAEGEAIEKQFPEIQHHLWKNFGSGGFSMAAVRAASVILFSVDPDRHKKFFTALIEGVGINNANEPVAVLRNAMLRAHRGIGAKGGWAHGETMLRIFKAWNCAIRGERITNSKNLYRKGEEFQEPLQPLNAQRRFATN